MTTPPDLLRVMATRVDEICMEADCLKRRRKEQDKSLEQQDKGIEELKNLALGLARQLRTLEARTKQSA